jgi:hypothetical protein
MLIVSHWVCQKSVLTAKIWSWEPAVKQLGHMTHLAWEIYLAPVQDQVLFDCGD